ncbi:TetR family transcriptional regulator [Rhodobacterales bacterium HKCCE2091]|nr:TetR family transcriptional regulator [Rhodobacterales bacterium HKCCE2091]
MTGQDAPPGNVKVTRADWLRAARDALVQDGVAGVKVLVLADRLGVSRSSFYWYFRDRDALLDALLEEWSEANSAGLIEMAGRPAATVTEAVCNVFRCTVDPELFNMEADFAVRAWGRSEPRVAARVAETDARRLAALTAMFARHGYPAQEAETRALVLYYMQIGYDLAERGESLEARIARVPDYLHVFTGRAPGAEEVAGFAAYARAHGR